MVPAKHQLVRVTVVSPFGQHEIDLPADTPVSAFLPDLLAMAGMQLSQAKLAADGWHLTDAFGQPIPVQGTLAGHGVASGATVQLRRPLPGGSGQPAGDVDPRSGVGVLRERGAVTRHLPRVAVTPRPPDDDLDPLERAQAVLPKPITRTSRLRAASQAFLTGPERGPGDPASSAASPRPATGTDGGPGAAIADGSRAAPPPRRPSGLMQSHWQRQQQEGGAPQGRPVSQRADGPGPATGRPEAGERRVEAGAVAAGELAEGDQPRENRPARPGAGGAAMNGAAGAAGPAGTGSGLVSLADGGVALGEPGEWRVRSRPDPAGPGSAGPSGPLEPGRHRYRPADLTVEAAPSRLERARGRWRELDNLGRLDARITEPRLQHCATIAVVSPKGGVGKTTVTALLGTLFSLLRRDPIVAVDTNPDFGSLGRVLTPEQNWFVDDLARLVLDDDELSLTALDSLLGRAVHGLLVVPAPTEPERMAALDEDAYRRVITRLKDFFSLILLDCGTGLQDPALAAAIAAADQVVLLTDAQPATASLVAESTELLHQWGRPITVVVNRMPAKGAKLDVGRLSRYLPAARGLVVVPDDVVAATRLATGRFDWRDAPESWQFAVRRLATVLVSDWDRLGLTRMPG
jgi:MinD-like ATPase involved in chromosome partitioning or flagellar assembly